MIGPGKYNPHILLRSGHINTIYPVLFRNQDDPQYVRQRFNTNDDDFFDVDFIKKNTRRLAIICHGLEGSSHSKYVIGTSGLLSENDWDVAAVNHRSCSGEINHSTRMYHSGATVDLDFLIAQMAEHYDEISLVGFSLGGNMVLKYAGEKGESLNSIISGIVAISVPLDLRAGSICIGKPSNFIYERKFLKSLLAKMKIKARQHPDLIDSEAISQIRSLYDFDDLFTGPLHGFKDADDYYYRCSSKRFLSGIRRPALIINALDDPFLPIECYPTGELNANKLITMLTPKYGGHVGFVQFKDRYYWDEWKILEFINQQSLKE